jgi:hypothetical protein
VVHYECGRLDDAVRYIEHAHTLSPGRRDISLLLLCGLKQFGKYESERAHELRRQLALDVDQLTIRAGHDDPFLLYERLDRYGCAIVRDFVQPEVAAFWRNNIEYNLELLAEVLDDPLSQDFVGPLVLLCQQTDGKHFVSRYGALKSRGREWHDENYSESDLTQIKGHWKSILQQSPVRLAMWHFLRNRELEVQIQHSMVRRMHARGIGTSGDPHQDARLQNRQDLFLTLWIPLVSSGRDSPGLSLLPIRLNGYFPARHTECRILPADVPDELYVSPSLEPGDVIVHSTFSVHRGYLTADMSTVRSSIDVRFF